MLFFNYFVIIYYVKDYMEDNMEFNKYKCPVCNEQFKPGDDVVVCPECGAPHHRECYENTGHCHYEDKHCEDFSFEDLYNDSADNNAEGTDDVIICPKCKSENPKATFYCNKCGYPLNERDRNNNSAQNNQNPTGQPYGQPFNQNMPPFGFGGQSGMGVPFDPMAGIDSEEPIADDVTAGEMSKFVGKNTPYYILIFNRIKKFGNSRFNFSAFLFSGIYFLYRKMVGIGIIISLLIIGLTVGSTFIQISPDYQTLLSEILNMQGDSASIYSLSLSSYLTTDELILFYSPYLLSLVRGIIMIICGAVANRTYYKHCCKKIRSVKNKFKDMEGANINKELELSGGVNLVLAVCFAVAYVIITYIPIFL